MKYIQGDLLDAFDKGEVNVIMHQCNCVSGNRLSGIAKSIYNRYAQIKKVFDKVAPEFADYISIYIGDKYIVNLYTQYYPGPPTYDRFINNEGYELEDSFNNRLASLTLNDSDKIGIPLLASGLAKQSSLEHTSDLDYFKRYIAPIVEETLEGYDVTVFYL